ncbi:MAG: helix-turn-helix domain-containing protein [Nitrososphaeria archaeon]|nr:helix-turn-helix domain-containing protein [Nitrososphaeria archaeon]
MNIKAGFRYRPEYKTFAIFLYKNYYVRIHDIAKALNCSTRTVWKWIIAYRNGDKITRKGKRVRSDRYLREVKINYRINKIRQAFDNLLYWLNMRILYPTLQLDLYAIAEGEKPP